MKAITTYNSYKMSKEKARKELGKKIREIRKAKGLTQEGLGEKAGLSYKFIGEVERGRVNVSLDSLVGIATALDIKVGDLFKGEKILKIRAPEKSPLSKLTAQDRQVIKKALKLLDKTFSKK